MPDDTSNDLFEKMRQIVADADAGMANVAEEIAAVAAEQRFVCCCECSLPMTPEEIVYFDDRCTTCEEEWAESIEAYRKGWPLPPEQKAAFDVAFGLPRKTLH